MHKSGKVYLKNGEKNEGKVNRVSGHVPRS